MGGTSETISSTFIEYAIFIVLLPMLAFPIILFLGHIFNGNQTWIKSAKEGGLIALPIMVASFVLSMLLISEFIGKGTGGHYIGDWLSFGWMSADGLEIEGKAFGVGIYIDHITVMLLFVASFLCMLINIFSIGYMNTIRSTTTETTASTLSSFCSVQVCLEWFSLIPSFGSSSSGN